MTADTVGWAGGDRDVGGGGRVRAAGRWQCQELRGARGQGRGGMLLGDRWVGDSMEPSEGDVKVQWWKPSSDLRSSLRDGGSEAVVRRVKG